jgi:hypothetical protein
MTKVLMSNDDKLKRWRVKLEAANERLRYQAQFMGERLGAIAATRAAERNVRRIEREIAKLEDSNDQSTD